MKVKTILVVDDEMSIINAVIRSFIMNDLHYQPLVCMDGYEALEFMRTKDIDMVLLDIKMPNLDGMKVCEEVMADEKMKKIPILITSGNLVTSDREKLKSLGIQYFLDKPYNSSELFEKMKEILEAGVS